MFLFLQKIWESIKKVDSWLPGTDRVFRNREWQWMGSEFHFVVTECSVMSGSAARLCGCSKNSLREPRLWYVKWTLRAQRKACRSLKENWALWIGFVGRHSGIQVVFLYCSETNKQTNNNRLPECFSRRLWASHGIFTCCARMVVKQSYQWFLMKCQGHIGENV